MVVMTCQRSLVRSCWFSSEQEAQEVMHQTSLTLREESFLVGHGYFVDENDDLLEEEVEEVLV